jgi:hypothetical protein
MWGPDSTLRDVGPENRLRAPGVDAPQAGCALTDLNRLNQLNHLNRLNLLNPSNLLNRPVISSTPPTERWSAVKPPTPNAASGPVTPIPYPDVNQYGGRHV